MTPKYSKQLGSLTGPCVDLFPNLGTVNRNVGIDLEAQFYVVAANPQYLDSEQAMKTIRPADDYRFLILPR